MGLARGEDVYTYTLSSGREGRRDTTSTRASGATQALHFDSESVALTKTAHRVLYNYVQKIDRAFGVSGMRPTIIGTDSLSILWRRRSGKGRRRARATRCAGGQI